MKKMYRWVLVTTVVVMSLALSGCSTVKGMGDDLDTLGRGIRGNRPSSKTEKSTQATSQNATVTPVSDTSK